MNRHIEGNITLAEVRGGGLGTRVKAHANAATTDCSGADIAAGKVRIMGHARHLIHQMNLRDNVIGDFPVNHTRVAWQVDRSGSAASEG